MVHTEPHIKKGFFLIFKNDGIPPCSHNPVTLPLCPVAVSRVAEGGGQAGGGAAGVQVAQGPRDPARPAHRQAGGADRQGGHVISPPLPLGPCHGRGGVGGRRDEVGRARAERVKSIGLHSPTLPLPWDQTKLSFQDGVYRFFFFVSFP